jgi:L-ascorbate metabolism protein UlaG (beta-lactamase superfamily)
MRIVKGILWFVAVIIGLLMIGAFITLQMDSIGKKPGPEAVRDFEKLPYYQDGKFVNSVPTEVAPTGKMWGILKTYLQSSSKDREPGFQIPVRPMPASLFTQTPAANVEVYWMGHSSLLLEMGGKRYLIDPVLSERASMVQWVGPKRFHPAPLKAEDISEVDGVIISHNHYDHLDYETIVKIRERVKKIYVPLGVRETLLLWGYRPEQIVELKWWDTVTDGENQLVAAPARHFTGRGLFDRNQTLWCSWAIINSQQRVYFSGDSGMMPEYEEIGRKLGPFDLTLMGIGAANESWKDIHTSPAEAVEAHRLLRGKQLLPVHWGTFDLALHAWSEPMDELLRESAQQDVPILTPGVGEKVTLTSFASHHWWQPADSLRQ